MRSMNLRNKIIVYSVVVLLLNLIIIGVISYRIASATIYAGIVETNKSIAEQTVDNIDFVLQGIERETINAFEGVDFNQYLETAANDDTIVRNKTELSRIIKQFTNVTDNVEQVYVVGKQGQVYSNKISGENVRLDEAGFRTLLEQGDGRFQWAYIVMENEAVSRKLISLSRAIYDSNGLYNGFVVALLKERTFANFYPDAQTKMMMLVDRENRIVSANDPAQIGQLMPETFAVPSGVHEIRSLRQETFVVSTIESRYTGWKLYIATPYQDVFQVFLTDRTELAFFTLLCLLLFTGIIVFAANRLLAPFHQLNEAVDSINRSAAAPAADIPPYALRSGILGRIHLKTKLAFVLMACIVTPVVMLMMLSYSFTQSLVEKKMIEVITINAQQTMKRMTSYTANLERTVYYFYYDDPFISALGGGVPASELYPALDKTVANAMNQKTDIAYIDIYNADMQRLYTSKKRSERFMYPAVSPESIEKNAWQDTYRDQYKDDLITFGRKIGDMRSGRIIGYIFITLKEKELAKLYSGMRTERNEFFVINSSSRIMSHANKHKIGELLEPGLASYIDPLAYEGKAVRDAQDSEVISYADIGISGWKLVNVGSLRSAKESMEKIWLYDLLVLLASVLSIGIFVIRYTGRIGKPINQLTNQVVRLAEQYVGDYEQARVAGDEIEQLRSNVYLMISKIDTLIKEVYEIRLKKNEAELKQKEAELITLQSQINPHFLYNTLEVIRWKAAFQIGGDNEVSDLVATLSEYFRLSLSQGRRTITLAEELEHVNRYIKIMSHRYRDKIEFKCETSAAALTCIVPKITLQPIVENALYHGIKLRSGKGTIAIDAAVERDELRITVSDDGIGMDDERLARLQAHIAKPEAMGSDYGNGGYGLQNIQQRIAMLYGSQYGLAIASAANEGTSVTIRMRAKAASLANGNDGDGKDGGNAGENG
ncbi:sensor histidine kinase [Paenibacillus sp. MBLB4367]|uniref:cache domain-containing sensor histidine kinase n=1 Tax=Paenibacillus sp. MBLB4367 TaxID=3384767 RepID=UPI003907EF3F